MYNKGIKTMEIYVLSSMVGRYDSTDIDDRTVVIVGRERAEYWYDYRLKDILTRVGDSRDYNIVVELIEPFVSHATGCLVAERDKPAVRRYVRMSDAHAHTGEIAVGVLCNSWVSAGL